VIVRAMRFSVFVLAGLLCLIATARAGGALYFDLPIAWLRAPLAFIYGGAMLAALLFVKGRWRVMRVVVGLFAVVLSSVVHNQAN
jgi:hypothetical protein